MKMVYHVISENWKIIKNDQDFEIFISNSKKGRFYTVVYMSTIFLTNLNWKYTHNYYRLDEATCFKNIFKLYFSIG